MRFIYILVLILSTQVLYGQNSKKNRINSLIDSIEKYDIDNLRKWSFKQRNKNSYDEVMFDYIINDSICSCLWIIYIRHYDYKSLFKKNKLKDTTLYYINGTLLKKPIEEEISENYPYTLSDVKRLENFVVKTGIQAMYWSKTKIRFETEKFTLYYYYPPTDTLVLNEKKELRHIRDNWYVWDNK